MGVRTFISISPPPEVAVKMAELQQQLKPFGAGVKWERPDQFHATLKFLGDVDPRALPGVIAAVERASSGEGVSPFEVIYESLGVFPPAGRPRVLWIGCSDPGGKLLELKTKIDSALLPLGFAVEDRPFHPHVTLGRVRDFHHLTPIGEKCTFEPRSSLVDGIFVMKSTLTHEGGVYSRLHFIHFH